MKALPRSLTNAKMSSGVKGRRAGSSGEGEMGDGRRA